MTFKEKTRVKKWVRYNNDYYYVLGRDQYDTYMLINSLENSVFLPTHDVENLEEFIPEQYNEEEQILYKPYKSSDIYCGKIININNDSLYRPYLMMVDKDSIWVTPIQLCKYNI